VPNGVPLLPGIAELQSPIDSPSHHENSHLFRLLSSIGLAVVNTADLENFIKQLPPAPTGGTALPGASRYRFVDPPTNDHSPGCLAIAPPGASRYSLLQT